MLQVDQLDRPEPEPASFGPSRRTHRRAVQLWARPVGVAVGRVFMDRFCTFVASDRLQQAD